MVCINNNHLFKDLLTIQIHVSHHTLN